MTPRRTIGPALAVALAALLAACGGQAAVPPTPLPVAPTAAPTEPPAPTAAPTEPPAPTAAPTEPPAAGAVLPRALYLLQAGQIFRLEADGETRTQVTDEAPFRPDVVAITDFAVSPAGDALAYTLQREGTPALIRSGPDGQDPTPIFDSAEVAVSEPLFTPDGQFVAARLMGLTGPGASFQSGLYLIPIDGGEPQLIVADEGNPDPATLSFGHAPAAFAPGGERLLTYRFALATELCELAVVSLPDGAAVPLQVPPAPADERVTSCGPAAWSADGEGVYYAPSPIGAQPGVKAIWRADAATGESFPITPQTEAPPYTLYAYPGLAPDGSLRAFMTRADAMPVPFEPPTAQLAYTMVGVDPADGTAAELRPAVEESPGGVLWAPDGSGAVALLFPEVGDPGLFWLPAGAGEPALLLGATTDLFSYEWAAEEGAIAYNGPQYGKSGGPAPPRPRRGGLRELWQSQSSPSSAGPTWASRRSSTA